MQFDNGVKKFESEFDILSIANDMRINKLIQELVFTK